MQLSFAQNNVLFGHHMVGAVNKDRQNVELQRLRQLEGSFVETENFTWLGACAFGENHHGIAAFHQVLQAFQIFIVAVGNRIIFGITDDEAINRVFPYPVRRQQHHLRVEHDGAQQVEMRLVVGDDDGGLFEGFTILVDQGELHPRQQLQGQAHDAGNNSMIKIALLFFIWS